MALLNGSSVAAIDTAALSSGEELACRKILIATAGQNRQLAIPGPACPGIGYLRTVADRDAIKQQADTHAGQRAPPTSSVAPTSGK